jgi:hypothetical protein
MTGHLGIQDIGDRIRVKFISHKQIVWLWTVDMTWIRTNVTNFFLA